MVWLDGCFEVHLFDSEQGAGVTEDLSGFEDRLELFYFGCPISSPVGVGWLFFLAA